MGGQAVLKLMEGLAKVFEGISINEVSVTIQKLSACCNGWRCNAGSKDCNCEVFC